MNSPYFLRLLCLSFASFFVLHLCASAVTLSCSWLAVRFAQRISPRSAARLLFALRMFPAAFSLLLIVGLCIPSYLWFEPDVRVERVGLVCLVVAALGAAAGIDSLWRSFRAISQSRAYRRRCANMGQVVSAKGVSTLVAIEGSAPVLAFTGLLRPQFIVSRDLMNGLSSDELGVALDHELAHHASRDNLKRLLFILTPNVLPFVGRAFDTLERNWARFTEWAADDVAAQGDPLRAVSLASALVRVAKLGTPQPAPELGSSLITSDCDLAQRVDRLLQARPVREKNVGMPTPPLIWTCAAGVVICAAVLSPAILPPVHRLLEYLVR